MTMAVQGSIIICTYNRSRYLIDVLANLTRHYHALFLAGTVELIVIDNNSSDDTELICRQLQRRHNYILYYKETNQGLSFARNRGVVEARGDILLFLDDDVEVDKGWYEQIMSHFQDARIGSVGGKILPFNAEMPSWLPPDYYYLLGIYDLGEKPLLVNKAMGANFAVRRNLARSVGFNTDLGRKKDLLLAGEEVDLFFSIIRMNYLIMYDPNAIVHHKISEKLTREYVLRCAYWTGRSEAVVERKHKVLKYVLKVLYGILARGYFIIREKDTSRKESFMMRFLIKRRYYAGYLSH